MITSKLTRQGKTTIPKVVRNALGVRPGDEIAYAIADGRALITKTPPAKSHGAPLDDPFAAFWEWGTPEDEKAFRDL